MRYGLPAFLLGGLVAFLLYCLGLGVSNGHANDGAFFNVGVFWFAVMFGAPVVVAVKLPLAAAMAISLRRVPDQRLHVVAFGIGEAAFMLLFVLMVGTHNALPERLAIDVLGPAICAAAGRASVMGLVARRNASPLDRLTGRSLSSGTARHRK